MGSQEKTKPVKETTLLGQDHLLGDLSLSRVSPGVISIVHLQKTSLPSHVVLEHCGFGCFLVSSLKSDFKIL